MKNWITTRSTDTVPNPGREGWLTLWRGSHKSANLPNVNFGLAEGGKVGMSRWVAGSWVTVVLDEYGNVEVLHGPKQHAVECVAEVAIDAVFVLAA